MEPSNSSEWTLEFNDASGLASIAGEAAMGEIFREGKIHVASPAASGRIAMAVYGALSSCGYLDLAPYWAAWWETDGGDLEPVPDGTLPNDRP